MQKKFPAAPKKLPKTQTLLIYKGDLVLERSLTWESQGPLYREIILAHKGIVRARLTLLELYRLDLQTWSFVFYIFKRKEVQEHDEDVDIVCASLKGKNVLIIDDDDVITAGTTLRKAVKTSV